MRKILALLAVSLATLGGLATPAHAAPLPKEVVVNGVEFVHVPEGWFWYAMENTDWDKAGRPGELPHYRDVKVWLDGYYVAKFEARARDFKRFMDSPKVAHRAEYGEGEKEGCAVRRKASGAYYLVDPKQDLPVTHLPWNLANEFAQWMGLRLLTEAEWVKAARGSDKRMWPWGDEYPDDTRAGYNANFDCQLAPVDSFASGVSPYGAYNMSGNVFELVQDWFNTDWDKALKDNARNPKPADQGTLTPPNPRTMKILRGGRWASPANGITVYRRNLYMPDKPFICHGTRFAIDEAKVADLLAKGVATVVTP